MISKVIVSYLRSHIGIMYRLVGKRGNARFISAMNFLGINPFTIETSGSLFASYAKQLARLGILIQEGWIREFYNKARLFGFRIELHTPHKGYSWHIHLNGQNGKIKDLHIQLTKTAWNLLKKIMGR